MKTNLLAQNDNLVIENLKADVGKSVMDLSHSVTFPVDVDGAIYPICCVETVPSDSFEINVECLLRQLAPLTVPLMTNFRLNTAFYYCDNRLAWKKWDRFMTGGRSGNDKYDIPVVANVLRYGSSQQTKYDLIDKGHTTGATYNNINYKTTLHTYFGISMNHTFDSLPDYADFNQSVSELPVAFPFFDYQIICRDFYTNVDRLPQNPKSSNSFYNYDDLLSDWAYSNLFPVDDDEIRLIDGVQIKSGFNTGDDLATTEVKGFILDKIRYHDVRPDYFTTSKAAPMRGAAPELTASAATLKLPSGTTLNLTTTTVKGLNDTSQISLSLPFVDAGGQSAVQDFGVVKGTSDVVTGAGGIPADAQTYFSKPVANVNEISSISGTTTTDLSLTGQLSSTFTASDIRLLSQLTVWQELNMLHEPYYNDFLNAHFDGVRVGESPVEKPQYIGGTSQIISINEVLQTSESTQNNPLGKTGATAMSLANNFVGRYYCNNYGYIIGVAYIVPELMYKPAMPRNFSRRAKEDYYSPEFANLSMQATLNKEIFFSNDDEWNNTPWGYTGAFDEMRSIPNRIAGDLLNPGYQDLQAWVLTRQMSNDNKPAMESTWLSLKGNVPMQAWTVDISMPKFMLQCANYIKAVRPMPKIAIPKAL